MDEKVTMGKAARQSGMPMTEQPRPDVLETLVCELGRRPKDAPTIADIVGSVRAVRREADALAVEFDPAAAELVAAVVDAERQCCSTLGWHLERDPEVRLRISATPPQLETLEAMFSAAETGEA